MIDLARLERMVVGWEGDLGDRTVEARAAVLELVAEVKDLRRRLGTKDWEEVAMRGRVNRALEALALRQEGPTITLADAERGITGSTEAKDEKQANEEAAQGIERAR